MAPLMAPLLPEGVQLGLGLWMGWEHLWCWALTCSPSCFQRCRVHTDTAITCPSPAASNVTVGTKPAPVDFYLNGRIYTDERSALDEELYPEEALHVSKFSLGYYADPQFSTAKKEKWIKHHPGEPLTLVIHVRGWMLQLCYALGAAISTVLSFSTGMLTDTGERRGWVGTGEAGPGDFGSACSFCISLPQEMQPGLGMPSEARRQRAAWGGCCSKGLNEILDVWKRTTMPWPETRQVLQKSLTIGVYSCTDHSIFSFGY